MKSILPFLLATACALAAAERGFGPDAAREEMKKLEVADGLEVTLFASEPMLVKLIPAVASGLPKAPTTANGATRPCVPKAIAS
jgi:hypothetical protein